jgi:hypothetical protein
VRRTNPAVRCKVRKLKMKVFMKLSVLLLLFIPLLIIPQTIACTIFTASNGERVLFEIEKGHILNNKYSKSIFNI